MDQQQIENAERAMQFWHGDAERLKTLIADALYELDCLCPHCGEDMRYRMKLETIEATAGHIARAARKRLDEAYGL